MSAPSPALNSVSEGKTCAAAGAERSWVGFALRSLATAVVVGGYYWVRDPLNRFVGGWYLRTFGASLDPTTPRVIGVLLLLAVLVAVWRKLVLCDPRFQAPLLVTTILAVGDAAFNILENHPAPPWLV